MEFFASCLDVFLKLVLKEMDQGCESFVKCVLRF